MRVGIVIACIVYILVADGGTVLGPFAGNADCQSYRQVIGAGGYCLPLWE